MTGFTDSITAATWLDTSLVRYVLADDALQVPNACHGRQERLRQRGSQPEFSDNSEVITGSLFFDTTIHGDEELELALLRQYHADLFPRLLPAGPLNARRRALGLLTERARQYITYHWSLIGPQDSLRAVGSAPISVCTYARAPHNATLADQEYYSVMSRHKAILFGLRRHVLISAHQVVGRWGLAPAAPQGAKALPAQLGDLQDVDVLANRGFHDPGMERELACKHHAHVWATPPRNGRQPCPAEFQRLVTRVRRRVETALSAFAIVFHVERPGSRCLECLVACVATQLVAYSLCFIPSLFLAQLPG